MCRACRYHFVIRISSGTCGATATGSKSERPEHHYVLESAREINEEAGPTKSLPPDLSIFEAQYMCSACSQRVTITVSSPRLKSEWITKITDKTRIYEAVRAAREQDPTRYENVPQSTIDRWANTPLVTLNQYIKGTLQDPEPRRIASRNKTFTAQFGQNCSEIFQYLGFYETLDEETGEPSWNPPRLEPQNGKTPLGSMRAFLEDVRSEVQSLMEQKTEDGRPVVTLAVPTGPRLEMHFSVAPVSRMSTAMVNPDEEEQIDLLGTTPDAEDELLIWAYQRQVAVDPLKREAYLDALSKVAAGRDMDLQLFCFAQQSIDPSSSQREGEGAEKAGADNSDASGDPYKHFNLKKEPMSADQLIKVYRTFCDQSPAQKREHRDKLYYIGKDLNEATLIREATTFRDEDEACHYLGVEKAWPLESIAVMGQVAAESGDHPPEIVRNAITSIADTMPPSEIEGKEWKDVMLALDAKVSGKAPAEGDNTTLMGGKENSMLIPVGLGNIRNTCYLNSILQYLYTVDDVRNLVCQLNLPDIDSNTGRLQGETEDTDVGLERRKAYVGCEFVRELRGLYEEMKRTDSQAVRPRQQLANAALLRGDKTIDQPSQAAPTSGSAEKEAPALPPRAAPVEEQKIGADVFPEAMETASVVSSQTLVDKPDDDLSTTAEQALKTPKDKALRTLTVKELRDEINKTTISGTDQMDVDEVMGNILDHLQAAFKVANPGHPETEADPIKQAFFSTWIESKKKDDEAEWTRTPIVHRWMTSFVPQDGRPGLYETLNPWLLGEKRGDKFVFNSLKRPAPHFHICLIRNATGRARINTPVKIHETLYLDRFMYTTDDNSPLFKARQRAWDISTRIHEIESGRQLESSPAQGTQPSSSLVDDYLVTQARLDVSSELDDDVMIVDSEVPGDAAEFPLQESPTSPPDTDMEEFWKKFDSAEMDEKTRLQRELDSLFSSFQDHPYRLHAVVCHAGDQVIAGHYFVYIRDFKNKCWYKLNDDRVGVYTEASVMNEITTQGQSYYLAYVDAKKVDELVSIPSRAGADDKNPTAEGQSGSQKDPVSEKTAIPEGSDAWVTEENPGLGILRAT